MWLKLLSYLLMICLALPAQTFAMPVQMNCPGSGMMETISLTHSLAEQMPDCCQAERAQHHCQDLNHCSASFTPGCNSSFTFPVVTSTSRISDTVSLPLFSQQRHSIWRPPC